MLGFRGGRGAQGARPLFSHNNPVFCARKAQAVGEGNETETKRGWWRRSARGCCCYYCWGQRTKVVVEGGRRRAALLQGSTPRRARWERRPPPRRPSVGRRRRLFWPTLPEHARCTPFISSHTARPPPPHPPCTPPTAIRALFVFIEDGRACDPKSTPAHHATTPSNRSRGSLALKLHSYPIAPDPIGPSPRPRSTVPGRRSAQRAAQRAARSAARSGAECLKGGGT